MKPVILISHKYYDNDEVIGIKRKYGVAISAAGGIPFTDACGSAAEYASVCDGILFTGGMDIEPKRYGGENASVKYNEALDGRELELFERFYKEGKPIMGICRGVQLINAALGGTLFTDIGASHLGGALHKITTVNGSLVNELLGESAVVNSYHHQAADKIAPDLTVTAVSADGIAEALEHRFLPIFGVQWHPERLDDCGNRRLFEHFVSMCKKSK